MVPLGTSGISHPWESLLDNFLLLPSWLRKKLVRPSGSISSGTLGTIFLGAFQKMLGFGEDFLKRAVTFTLVLR